VIGDADDGSRCGCSLPAGCWGSDGWHNAIYDEAAIEFRISAEVRADEHLSRRPGDTAQRERGIRRFWQRYLGCRYVYERCPAYMAVFARSLIAAREQSREKGPSADRRRRAERRQ
jgi:hypothetical protein